MSDPTIVAATTVETTVGLWRNGDEWWLRLTCGGVETVLHPVEARLFAGAILAYADRARGRTRDEKREGV